MSRSPEHPSAAVEVRSRLLAIVRQAQSRRGEAFAALEGLDADDAITGEMLLALDRMEDDLATLFD